MSVFFFTVICGTSYVAQNKNIKEECKIGYYAVNGVLCALILLYNILTRK